MSTSYPTGETRAVSTDGTRICGYGDSTTRLGEPRNARLEDKKRLPRLQTHLPNRRPRILDAQKPQCQKPRLPSRSTSPIRSFFLHHYIFLIIIILSQKTRNHTPNRRRHPRRRPPQPPSNPRLPHPPHRRGPRIRRMAQDLHRARIHDPVPS